MKFTGFQRAPIEDPVEREQYEELQRRVEEIEGSLQRWSRVANVEARDGTELALDDSFTRWRSLGHSIAYQLNHAADTLNALRTLIGNPDDPTVPFVAHFPVARSGLEASSLALWTLAPDDPLVRIERHSRNVWREISDETNMMNATLEHAKADLTPASLDHARKQQRSWKRKHLGQLRAMVERVGLEDPSQSGWTVGFAEVVRDATAAVGMPGHYGETVWRELSGLSHPSFIRANRSMKRDQVMDNGDGTLSVLVTSDAAKVKLAVEACQLQFRAATDILARRKIQRGDPAAYRPTGSANAAAGPPEDIGSLKREMH